jgi:hypothetical protein
MKKHCDGEKTSYRDFVAFTSFQLPAHEKVFFNATFLSACLCMHVQYVALASA